MPRAKKRFVPLLQQSNLIEVEQANELFSKLLESVGEHVKEGSVVKGQVVDVTKDIIIVDVGLKNEGRIPIEEFALAKTQPLPKIGDMVDVFVERLEGKNGRTILSREKAIREEAWVHLEEAWAKKEPIDGVIFGRVKGGFAVDLSGVVAFLPGSQVDVRPVKDMSPLMDIVQPFVVLNMEKKIGNVIVSRRAIFEAARLETREQKLATIKEGMILEGVVKNITDYGVFVELEQEVDGLLYVNEIAWNRINHPSEVLTLGQEVKVVVIKFNEETKRISLSMKQLHPNPWQDIKREFPSGTKMKGKVTNIVDYGAFIELKEGIEGLVHSSEISWLKSNQHPRKLLTVNQEVEFIVLEVDVERSRISLSIKQCEENPLIEFSHKHPVGSVIKAHIKNITDFCIFVSLAENIEGMIHENDLSTEGKGEELLKSFKRGDEIECKILSIDIEKERVSLGVKQLTANSSNKENLPDDSIKNRVVTCSVITILENGIEVELEDKTLGFIKKAELSSSKSEQRPEKFSVGDRVDAKVISTDLQSGKVLLSVKALEMEEQAKAIEKYGSANSGASLSNILSAAIDEVGK